MAKSGQIAPESQLWTLEESHRARIAKGLAWAAQVVLRPAARDVGTLKGLLHRAGRKPVSIEAMNVAIEHRRSRKR